MIVINRRQVEALLKDLEDDGAKPHEFFELHQLDGHGGGPPHRTVEGRFPDTEHQVTGNYYFPDGTTGY